ncbi:hypothetical protein C8J56DRAFT_1051758 [Mycena floridula]|nr:hypothetical protein C8J56DRAFT_1051758 [Mycena floridula]
MAENVPSVLQDLQENLQTNLVGFAGFTVLIWDHLDTIVEEVDHIWKKKKTLQSIPNTSWFHCQPVRVHGTSMDTRRAYSLFSSLKLQSIFKQRCAHFIRYEGAMTTIGINTVGLMMFLRPSSIRALYHSQIWVQAFVGFILGAQIVIMAYLMTTGERVVHNPDSGVKACTMIFPPELSTLASSSAWMPLLYDSIVFGLTLNRTLPAIRNRSHSYVIKRLFQDGLMYYSIIFSINAVLTLMIISAPPGLKNITAQLELLITVAMMSRITLNLRKSSGKEIPTVNAPAIIPQSQGGHPAQWRVAPFSQNTKPGPQSGNEDFLEMSDMRRKK